MNIEITSNPEKEDLKTISEGIQNYNQYYIPDEVVFEKDTKFTVFAKDDNGKVVGGIRACAFWNYCIIELLWLSEKTRGLGIGKKLIKATEEFALEKGFNYVRTETLSFQARPFYEKLGYRVFGELPDYPKGHTTYCLVKELKQFKK
ncbi:GNAT family N-acetyltransferase [uncultured Algibacter sp.]|uniref:GNAT family N-acetyltransferase n=1 Tax=uncultured Algibacter sp. TaxID=298659 RepID=UPI00261E35B9|nr:GNAT family N-acetyltransferase [uncultured Algibacter sp.]